MRDQSIISVISKRYLLIVAVLCNMVVLVSCDSKPSHQTEQAWQQSFREALLAGYSTFKGHFVDTDATVYIFSYKLPPKMEVSSVISTLRKQINAYSVVTESKNELVMRRSGKPAAFQAFDEYRFFLDEKRGEIIVMFASIDSPVELKSHPVYIKKYHELCGDYSKRSAS